MSNGNLFISIPDMSNDAFKNKKEYLRILSAVIKEMSNGDTYGKCRDTNGNTVGDWEYNRPKILDE